VKLVKSVRAGEGFISQSSKWLHFGMGNADGEIEVVVRWPDGARGWITGHFFRRSSHRAVKLVSRMPDIANRGVRVSKGDSVVQTKDDQTKTNQCSAELFHTESILSPPKAARRTPTR